MRVAVVGATGMVGHVMLEVLKERNFPLTELILVASERSVGKVINFRNKNYKIIPISEAVSMKPDIALFSAGGQVSLDWSPRFSEVGTTVIDNSSAWRMDDSKKLIVPEVNAEVLTAEDKIIANPNCSTIQMVLVLAPLHSKYKIKRVVVSTYQSITGTGVKAVEQLEKEILGEKVELAYHYQIHKNAIPHCDIFEDNAYTKEEMKLVRETKKILRDDKVSVTATAVRIPVVGGHSESVNIEFENDFRLEDVRDLLQNSDGIILKDSPETNTYPMPLYAKGEDEVFVGRIRRDETQPNTINMWIVADNLRKGAATNTIQIAEYLIKNKLV